MKLGTIDAKKWRSPIFVENSFLLKFAQKGPKNLVFRIFFENAVIYFRSKQCSMNIPLMLYLQS